MTRVRHYGASGQIFQYLAERIGQTVSVKELSRLTGANDEAVSKAISYLRTKKNIPIRIVLAGKAWRLEEEGTADSLDPTPTNNSNGSSLKHVGTAGNGDLVIEDQKTGTLYRATPL